MRRPAGTIWDTRIQCICSVVCAREGDDVELWMCANFGQVALGEARIAVNPNRLYPIEASIRKSRQFSIGVFAHAQRETALRLARVRRRAVDKPGVVGLRIAGDERTGIPYAPDCLRTLFCEAEQILDTGDHTLIVARILESRARENGAHEEPLLYREIAGEPPAFPRLERAAQWALARTGAKERIRQYLARRRGAAPADLPARTYEEGGQTEQEVADILRWGLRDTGRTLSPPQPSPGPLARRVGVAVVGSGNWGPVHCRLLKQADPGVDLYICSRDAARAERLARATGARDVIVGLERAVADSRVEALTLALPHHLHAGAAIQAAAAGKHVLVEKPIAITLDDADRMIQAAAAAGTILMVAEDMHFRPAIRQAVRMIAAGDIGEPLYMTACAGGVMRSRGWKADPALMGGGVLMDLGVHYVRAMRLLMGEPDEVMASRAMQVDTKTQGEDSARVWFRSRFGWQAELLLNWAGPRGYGPDITVHGDRGVLHLWPGRPYVDLYPAAPRPLVRMLSYARPAWLAEKLIRPEMQRLRVRFTCDDSRGYLGEMREFVSAVAERRPPATPPRDAHRDLEIVLRAYDALRSGAWVPAAPAVAEGTRRS